MPLDPCLPIRFMSNAGWLRFLAEHPGWRAPLNSLGPCARAGLAALPLLAVGPAALPVLPSPSWGGLGPNAYDTYPYSSPGGYGDTGDFGNGVGLVGLPVGVGFGGGFGVGPAPDRTTPVVERRPDLVPVGLPPMPSLPALPVPFDVAPVPVGLLPGALPDVVPELPVGFTGPDRSEPTPVPEPSSIACMIAALLAVTCLRRRKATGRDGHPNQSRTSNTEMTHA